MHDRFFKHLSREMKESQMQKRYKVDLGLLIS